MVAGSIDRLRAGVRDVPNFPKHGIVFKDITPILVDSQLFRDPFAGDKFAHFLYRAHEQAAGGAFNPEQARQRVQEAQLFIEAAHACVERMDKETAAATVAGAAAPAE